MLEEIDELQFACISYKEAKKILQEGGYGVVYYACLAPGTQSSDLELVNMRSDPDSLDTSSLNSGQGVREAQDWEQSSGLESLDIQSLKNGQDIHDIDDLELQQLLGEYKNIFRNEMPEGLPPKRAIEHEINTGSESPVNRNAYPLSIQ